MSVPNLNIELRDKYEDYKKEAYSRAGLIPASEDVNEKDWIGTKEQWNLADSLLDELLTK